MNFLDKLDFLMKQKNIKNLHALSEQANIPYTTLKNFSVRPDGTEKIKLSTLNKLKDFFGCTLDYLVDDNVTNPYQFFTVNSTLKELLDNAKYLTPEQLQKLNEFINTLKNN